jgi:hypothetical protein
MEYAKSDFCERDRIIMANARRLIKKTSVQNWVLCAELFGVGSTTARKRCIDMGIDPDSKSSRQSAPSPE